jgi:hypothetical protein
MKLLSTIIFAAAVLAVPTIASAKDCGNPPAKLSLPNGANATEDEMKATQAKFPPYAAAMKVFLTCLSEQMKAGTAEYQNVADDWAKQQKIFTSQPAK